MLWLFLVGLVKPGLFQVLKELYLKVFPEEKTLLHIKTLCEVVEKGRRKSCMPTMGEGGILDFFREAVEAI